MHVNSYPLSSLREVCHRQNVIKESYSYSSSFIHSHLDQNPLKKQACGQPWALQLSENELGFGSQGCTSVHIWNLVSEIEHLLYSENHGIVARNPIASGQGRVRYKRAGRKKVRSKPARSPIWDFFLALMITQLLPAQFCGLNLPM